MCFHFSTLCYGTYKVDNRTYARASMRMYTSVCVCVVGTDLGKLEMAFMQSGDRKFEDTSAARGFRRLPVLIQLLARHFRIGKLISLSVMCKSGAFLSTFLLVNLLPPPSSLTASTNLTHTHTYVRQ